MTSLSVNNTANRHIRY